MSKPTNEAMLRAGKRLTARLRDLVADLREQDEALLRARDRTVDEATALDLERSAHEARVIADKIVAILASDDANQFPSGGSAPGLRQS